MSDFTGFSKGTLTFLRGVRQNNNKAWFAEHRDDYEKFYLEPAKDLVIAAGSDLRKIAPGIRAEPRVNGSILRVNRDIRFSKDKRPYKEHLDLWFWEGERKQAVSGFFFRLTPDGLGLGAGAHGFDRDRLEQFRMAVTSPSSGRSLVRAVGRVEKAGWEVRGEHYKRTPAGYEASGRAEELLRYAALWVGEDEPIPDKAFSSELVDYCMSRWEKAAPIHRWLVKNLQ